MKTQTQTQLRPDFNFIHAVAILMLCVIVACLLDIAYMALRPDFKLVKSEWTCSIHKPVPPVTDESCREGCTDPSQRLYIDDCLQWTRN